MIQIYSGVSALSSSLMSIFLTEIEYSSILRESSGGRGGLPPLLLVKPSPKMDTSLPPKGPTEGSRSGRSALRTRVLVRVVTESYQIGEVIVTALPAVAKVVRVDHHYAQYADPNIMIRLFFQYAGTLSLADATTWLTAIVTAQRTFVSAMLSSTLALNYSELTDLSSNTAPQVANSTGQVGGDGNPPLSAGVAMVISYTIARRYRGGKPRTYLPGMSAGFLLNPSQWDPTEMASFATHWQTYLTAATTTPGGTAIGAINHVNVSYYQGFVNHTYPSGRVKAIPQLRVTPLVDVITGLKVNGEPASQRRRNEQP
jgi:hypothetical protein